MPFQDRLGRLLVAIVVLLGGACAVGTTAAHGQARIALVVGNNAYLKLPSLSNAVNDAVAVSEELRKFGFQVIRVVDGNTREINEAKRRFLTAIANGGIGVFFFSGHGVQVEGRNYLLPVDFAAQSVTDLAQSGISVPNVLDEVESVRPKLSIVILDACRDNPFTALPSGVASTRGLSEAARQIPSGTLILYAASSNQTALDGLPNQRSVNGLFSGELLSAMKDSNLEVRDLARKVRYSVMEKAQTAGHLQVPALYDNLSLGAFYFDPRAPLPTPTAIPAVLPPRIKIVIPFAPQGPSDAIVRTMGPFLARALNREIVFENQVDVQGDRVAALLAAAPKDGSVLLVSPYAAAARRLAANDTRLLPLGIFADTPLSLIVNAGNRARDLAELRNATRTERRKLRMTVPLRGSPAEMCGQQFKRTFGADLVDLVTVNGEAAAVLEVINGTADVTCANTASVRGLAPPNKAKIRELAEVRTTASPLARRLQVSSTGAQGFDIIAPNWLGLFAPNGMNPDLARDLTAAIGRLQANPAYAQAIAQGQALPVSAEQATPAGLLQVLRLALVLQR